MKSIFKFFYYSLVFQFFFVIQSIAQVPVILSQPPSVINYCEGSNHDLEVITDQHYSYQWYTVKDIGFGQYGYTALPGENNNVISLKKFNIPFWDPSLKFVIKVASATDTLLSESIVVNFIDMPVPIDTVLVCDLPAMISFKPIGYSQGFQPLKTCLWSTGNTDSYFNANDYGKYWVKRTHTVGELTCVQTDTFHIMQCPKILHVSGTIGASQYWCADTVFVDGNTNLPDEVNIASGTTVIYTGDYLLNTYLSDIPYTNEDTVHFIGNKNKVTGASEGSLYLGETSGRIKYFNFRDMNDIYLRNISYSRVSNCNRVTLYRASMCTIEHNNFVKLSYSVDYCTISENDSLLGELVSTKRVYGSLSLKSNTFRSNGTGIYVLSSLGDAPGCEGSLFIRNNKFFNNKGTPIISNISSTSIYQNLFINNTSETGPGVMLKMKTHCDFEFIGNTLFNNKGLSCDGIEIVDSPWGYEGEISSNIFWNSGHSKNSLIAISRANLEGTSINNNSFWGSEELLDLPVGHEIAITNNLFNTYPIFYDTLNSQYSLKFNSPLIDAGEKIIDNSSLDLANNPRQYGEAVDIGAYEYFPGQNSPIIYSQMGNDTITQLGNSLKIYFTTNDYYIITWWKDGIELTGQHGTIINFDKISLNDAGTYIAQISGLNDTICTKPINVFVLPLSESLLPNKLILCNNDSIVVSIPKTNFDIEWSTGDTTETIVVDSIGIYWVKVGKKGGVNACDTMEVLDSHNNIELIGNYKGDLKFCADTVKIVGDCNIERKIFITKGTVVKFCGDYSITTWGISSIGIPNDSVLFIGQNMPDNNTTCGTLLVTDNSGYSLYDVQYTKFINVKVINLPSAKYSKFVNCDSVKTDNVSDCSFIKNKSLWFISNVSHCTIAENNKIYFLDYQPLSHYFYFSDNIYKKNKAGFKNILGPASIREKLFFTNNQFIENSGPVIELESDGDNEYNVLIIEKNSFIGNDADVLKLKAINRVIINSNQFIENKGVTITMSRLPDYKITNNLFSKNTSNIGPGAILSIENYSKMVSGNISNNSFVSNFGYSYKSIEFNHSKPIAVELYNNIYWNNAAYLSNFEIGLKSMDNSTSNIKISYSAIQDSTKLIELPNNSDQLIVNNMYTNIPIFQDIINSNFRLSKNSPYIDAGCRFNILGYDLDGNIRQFGEAVDIGAYEYIPNLPLQFVSLTNDTLVCKNESITLKAHSTDRFIYNWYKDYVLINNENTDSLFIPTVSENDTGTYRAKITNLTTEVWSEKIHVSLAKNPAVLFQSESEEVCQNSIAELWIDGTSDLPLKYQWYSTKNGILDETTSHLTLNNIIESDTLTAIISSLCGSDTSGPILISTFEVSPLNLGNDTLLAIGDSIAVYADGIFQSYLWNNGSTFSTVYGKPGDTLWVEVEDLNGCIVSDTLILNAKTIHTNFVNSKGDVLFDIYPNPATQYLKIKMSEKLIEENLGVKSEIEIQNLAGETVGKYPFANEIDISNLLPGIYFIKMGEITSKFVKQ